MGFKTPTPKPVETIPVVTETDTTAPTALAATDNKRKKGLLSTILADRRMQAASPNGNTTLG